MKSVLILLLCLPLVLIGCGETGPNDKTLIDTVQERYDAEFLAALQTDGMISGTSKFSDTQALISTNRKTTENPTVIAYLNVLEGMIYLQTNQTGQAALIQPDVSAAARVLKGKKNYYPRDALFAKTFANLVAGRATMSKLSNTGSTTDADLKTQIALATDLTDAATQIGATLCSEQKAGRLAAQLDDAGAAMVAGFGASYLLDADVAMSKACGFDPSFDPACASFSGVRSQLIQAQNLRATFAGPDLREGSQLRSLDRNISTRLTQAYRGRTVPATQNICQ